MMLAQLGKAARFAGLAGATTLAACIPDDTTTARGGIALHFEPTVLMQRGAEFTTADGWHVVLEKTIVSLEALPGEGCNYKEADFGGIVYDARYPLLTLIRGAEARDCKYFVSLRGGLRQARVGPGATADDQLALAGVKDALGVPYALRYAGRATYGSEMFRFNFGVAVTGAVIRFKTLIPADDKVDTTFQVRPEEIFRAAPPNQAGPLVFTPLWLADQRGNRDGLVTNDELDRMRVSRSGGLFLGSDIALSDFFSLKASSIFKVESVNVGEPASEESP